MIFRGSINDWYSIPFLLAIVAVTVAARYWRFFVQWMRGIRGKEWAAVSASVDVVSVVVQTERGQGGDRIIGYLATLSYFYRNPELQTGDYTRMFVGEQDAQEWAASYKGRTVMVHVDPHDPSNSVLREEAL
jgi:hypothetical protein